MGSHTVLRRRANTKDMTIGALSKMIDRDKIPLWYNEMQGVLKEIGAEISLGWRRTSRDPYASSKVENQRWHESVIFSGKFPSYTNSAKGFPAPPS